MTYSLLHRYVCDFDGEQVVQNEKFLPDGWASVRVGKTDGAGWKEINLCHRCSLAVAPLFAKAHEVKS